MASPFLQLFRSDNPSIEVGTKLNPIDFGLCYGGKTTQLPYDLILFNDRGGSLGSEDVKNLAVYVLEAEITQEFTSTGAENQTFQLSLFPILQVEVYVNGTKWSRVLSFGSHSNLSEIYTCNLSTGLLSFGDGIFGKIPPSNSTIKVIYIPNLNLYGKKIIEEQWLSISSKGVVSNPVYVPLEQAVKLSNTQIQVLHYPIVSVVGVWDNLNKEGINYFTGGSVNNEVGIITLGTELTSDLAIIEYSYTIANDNILQFIPLSKFEPVLLPKPIPRNNAKILQLQVTIPERTSTEGGAYLKVRLRFEYEY